MTDKDRTLEDIISDITEQELAEKCPDVVITRDQLHQKIKKHRKRRLKKPVAFAVIAAVLVLGFIALWPMLSPNDIKADADKNAKEEILTDDGVIIEDKGWGSSSEDVILITDWDEIPFAKAHVDNLLVPEYMPKGYTFKEVRIESYGSMGASINILFNNGNEELHIFESINGAKNNSFEKEQIDDVTECEQGEILVKNYENKIIATIQIDDGIMVTIEGDISIAECIAIIESLK